MSIIFFNRPKDGWLAWMIAVASTIKQKAAEWYQGFSTPKPKPEPALEIHNSSESLKKLRASKPKEKRWGLFCPYVGYITTEPVALNESERSRFSVFPYPS